MNNSQSNHAAHPEATFREAGLDDIIKDVTGFAPAPNASREAFVTVVTIVIIAAGLGILQPEPLTSVVVIAAITAYTAVRWILGLRKWGQR